MFHNFSVGYNGAIVGRQGIVRLQLEEDIGRHGAKKEVSDGVTAGFFFKGVRVIAIQVQQHVVCTVSGFGTGMSHQIVEKFGDILLQTD